MNRTIPDDSGTVNLLIITNVSCEVVAAADTTLWTASLRPDGRRPICIPLNPFKGLGFVRPANYIPMKLALLKNVDEYLLFLGVVNVAMLASGAVPLFWHSRAAH